MKRGRTHQIDELAQRYLRDTIPATWIYNEHKHDYGKDYLVEPGDPDGELTGLNFFVQLKGQEQVELTADRRLVKFSLQTMHAAYYVDKIKELPVFLVVVDVNKKRGWYHFIQPALELNQTWRKQKSLTIYLPASNDLADTTALRENIESAKRMMRQLHPESIHDAITAHKERLRSIDPRFDVTVSLVNDKTMFEFSALQPVSGVIEFTGAPEDFGAKVSDLVDNGALVEFKPGEVKITGSPLFERFEQTGGAIQSALELPATVTLICKDAKGRELGRLSDVPGQVTGGRKTLWFKGALASSPLSVTLGPMAANMGGSASLNWKLACWSSQYLLHLAYFEQLFEFCRAWLASSETEIHCQVHGNRFFSASVPLETGESAKLLAEYLTLLDKARKVAGKFGINPAWTPQAFDVDSRKNAFDLYAIFFEGGLVRKMPHVRIHIRVQKKGFRSEVLKKCKGPIPIYLSSIWEYMLLGEKIEVGRLTQEFTCVNLSKKEAPGKKRTKKLSPSRVHLLAVGTEDTVMTARPGDLPQVQEAASTEK